MEYTEKIFHTFYVDQQDIGEIPVLRKAAEELGLDGEAFEAEIRSQKRLEELDGYKEWADAYEVVSLPTMIVEEEKVVGYHEPEEYAGIIDKTTMAEGGMHCGPDGNCG